MDDPAAEPGPDDRSGAARHRAGELPAEPASTNVIRSAVDWCFRSRTTGRITIAQLPNVPLWIFLASVVLRQVLPEGGTAYSTVSWLGTLALAWWALDELIRGVNPWRRLLGLVGIAFVVLGVAALLH